MTNTLDESEIRLLDTQEISSFSTSTHTSSILLVIEYLKKFIDTQFFVIGISIENNSFGEGFSKKILDSSNKFIEVIKNSTAEVLQD